LEFKLEWELELVEQLRQFLFIVILTAEEDYWGWIPTGEGLFTVKSAYTLLAMDLVNVEVLDSDEKRVFQRLWRSSAPLKVVAFSWQLLHNHIPTRLNLAQRRILLQDASLNRVACDGFQETVPHLFLYCCFSSSIWYVTFKWLGLLLIMPPNLFYLFDCLCGAAVGKNRRRHATV
jgi:hypothetical protein